MPKLIKYKTINGLYLKREMIGYRVYLLQEGKQWSVVLYDKLIALEYFKLMIWSKEIF